MSTAIRAGLQPLDVTEIRKDFGLLSRILNGKPVVYLDSAVSGQMPKAVIERMAKYERDEHTNVHRGVSTLSQEATDHFEAAREKVRKFIGADAMGRPRHAYLPLLQASDFATAPRAVDFEA